MAVPAGEFFATLPLGKKIFFYFNLVSMATGDAVDFFYHTVLMYVCYDKVLISTQISI